MKKLTLLFVVALFAATSAASSMLVSGAGAADVTGAGAGVFPSGSQFKGINLQGSTFGHGVIVYGDGTGEGDFFTVLNGTSLLGAPQSVVVSGVVANGSWNADGSVTFGGTSSVNMGDGTPPVSMPFTVTATTGGLTLVLGGTTLPTQTLADGGIAIEPW